MNTSATTNTNNKINISNNNAINDKSNTTASYQSSSAMLLSTPPRRGTKRKIASVANGNSPAIRKRRKLQHSSKAGESRLEQVPQTKNTVAVLNELKRNLVYKVESQTGPVHAPIFTISVVVDGQKFVGTGPSKKLARVAAAASALRSFIQFKDGATLTPIEPLQNVDFTSDDPMIENSIFPLSDAVVGPGVPQEKVAGAPVATGGSCGGKPAAVTESTTVNSNHSLHSNNSSNSNNNNTSSSKTPYSSSGCINNNNNGANRAAAAAGVAATNNSRQCDISGSNTTVHSNSHTTTNNSNTANSSHSSAIGPAANSNGSNWHRKDAAAAAAAADGEKQQQQQQHHHHHHQSAQDKPPAVGTVSNHNHNNNANASFRTAPAAASSIVTNKLKVSSGSTLRNSGNVAAGHHPKPQPEKGPVMLLHELFTDAHFECVSSDGLQHSKFTVVVTVNDNQRFEGTGPSKKMAKNAAAKAALASICNISFSPLQQSKFGLISAGTSNGSIGGPSGVALNGDNSFTQNKNFELPQTFADAVGKLVIEKFNEVMKGSDVYSRRKVLAGFVMTHGYDIKTARVISLATGTKCVSGEHMSVTGSVINDSHAEIIARRGLMDFFYSQLDLLCQQQQQQAGTVTAEEESASSVPPAAHDGTATAAAAAAAAPVVAVPSGGQEAEPNAPDRQARQEIIFNTPKDGANLYTLKDGIYFHLYINTAPCGDARVFSPHENDSMDVDKHPNRKARGQLRTKVESGEGTIPVKSSDGIQTWDGVLQGQRLLTMSCSDKISRWNVLGLQGSLLASIIEPIYLHSIVLGSLLHPAHMYRAICGRIESAIQGLPPPYRLNKPKLALMTSAESRNQTKPPNFSINWITNGTEVEIVNSFTGKLINNNTNTNKMSRLSKQSFYQRYSTVIAGLPGIPLREVKPTYFETKMSVAEYQQAKRELFAAFSKEDLGEWLKKPIEQDQFTLIVAKECSELGPQQALPQQAQQPQPPQYANQPQTVPMPADANTAAVGNVSSIGNSSK
ncbi:double-stranded RNA-specific editase Adar isoform X2 [Anopheles arabiensis]|uniref:A to I editase domain-containing protein n=1 Tax=Anopheles arabiensis TaxID=7173 RepID=A0A182HIC0_ANOAR|nr:double-stranded RNA-specific editase Adar isoform X2 [Anopheles arabiensis]